MSVACRCRWMVLAAAFVANVVPALTLLTEENPPFSYTDHGKLTGLVTELVVETARRAEVPVAMEVLPWARAFARAQAEKDTCVFATARFENREKLFAWVGPLGSNLWVAFGRGDFSGQVRLLGDLKSYRIGGVANDAKVEFLRENGVTNLRLALEDRQNPSRLLLSADDANHIDLWVTGFYGARTLATSVKAADLKLVFLVREIPLYLACSPQTAPATLKALSAAAETVRAEGLPQRLAAAYEKKFAQ